MAWCQAFRLIGGYTYMVCAIQNTGELAQLFFLKAWYGGGEKIYLGDQPRQISISVHSFAALLYFHLKNKLGRQGKFISTVKATKLYSFAFVFEAIWQKLVPQLSGRAVTKMPQNLS